MPRHPPGRVERVGGVRGRGSPALAGSLSYPHHLREGKRAGPRRAGWQTVEALPCCLLAAGRSVARWWRWLRPEADEVAALSSPWAMLRAGEVVSGWRWCGRVRTADRAEERRGTGEEVGGILRPVPLSSFALPVLFVPLLFSSVLALFFLYI